MSLRRCKEHKYGFMISLGDMLSDRTKTRGCYYCLLNEAIAFQKRIAELEAKVRELEEQNERLRDLASNATA